MAGTPNRVQWPSAALLSAVFERGPCPMLIADDEGRFVDANPAACAMFELSRAEFLKLSVSDLSAPEDRARVDEQWQAFIVAGSLRGEYQFVLSDGTVRQLDFNAVANFVPGLHLSILRDGDRMPHLQAHPPGSGGGAERDGQLSVDGGMRTTPLETVDGAPEPRRRAPTEALSPREQEVLELLAEGLRSDDIATRLFISSETVRTHVRNAMRKLGAHTRAQAVAAALRAGEIDL